MAGEGGRGSTEGPAPAVAYSYLRLSSKRQANAAEGKRYRDGFRRQVEMRDRYLAANPHLTLDTRLNLHDIGVSGYTGANAARGGPGRLAAFLDEVEAGRVAPGSHLLVESLDRMSRQQVNRAQALLLGIVNAGVVVVSLVDGQVYRDGGDSVQFILSIVSLTRAHEESLVKAARLRETWAKKRADVGARPLTARAPAWLKLVDGAFVPDDERVGVVRRVMGLLADGWGRDRIARALNEDRVPCWGHGRQWHGGTVQKLTDNRALVGYFQPHRLAYEQRKGVMVSRRVPVGAPVPGYFPVVVDPDLWDRAQAVALKRRMGKASNAGGRQGVVLSNLFGQLATCAVCGQAMNYRDRGPRSTPVLRCSSERAGNCSNAVRVAYHPLENIVLTWLVRVDVAEGSPGEARRLEGLLASEARRRDALQAKGEAIVREFGAGNRFARAPLAEVEAELKAVEAAVAELGNRVRALRVPGRGDERRSAAMHLFRLQLAGAPPADRYAARMAVRQLIRETVTSMACEPDGHVRVETLDGGRHVFRDGLYRHGDEWLPWLGETWRRDHERATAEGGHVLDWLPDARWQRRGRDPDV